MNRVAIVGAGLLGLAFLIGVTLGDPQEVIDSVPQDEPAAALTAPDTAEAETEDENPSLPVPSAEPSESRARGLRMDEDGFVFAQVTYIDPHTLDQIPVADAIVTFIQDRAVVAQAKSGPDGIFSVKGLSPYAVYSMFVRSEAWMCVVGTYVLPEAPEDLELRSAQTEPNQFVFASFQDPPAESTLDSASGDPKYEAIQVIPWQDFCAAIRLGVLDCCEVPPGSSRPLPSAGGGGGGGTFLPVAIPIWVDEDNELASPFRP